MKRNSIDLRIELLASARDVISACEARFAQVYIDTGEVRSKRPGWVNAMDRLKEAVAQYDQPL